jgi:hypothetical protein
METENQEQLSNFKEMINEQHESLFESISKIEETNNESLVETLKPTFVKKTDTETLSDLNSECECLKEVETKSNLELEQVKEPEPLKEVKTVLESESKKSVWDFFKFKTPFSWKFSKSKK